MGATPRKVTGIERNPEGYEPGMYARVEGFGGLSYLTPVGSLTRQEAISAAKHAFPDTSGALWMAATKETILAALESDDPSTTVSADTGAAVEMPTETRFEPVGSSYEPVTAVVEVPAPVPDPSTSNGSIDKAIRDLVAQVAAQNAATAELDETRVREIAAEAAAEALASLRPVVTRIEVIGRETKEPVEIAGRQHAEFETVLKAMSEPGNNLYLVGPPGTGKTHLAHEVARALGIPFGAISCSPTMSDTKLLGFVDANGVYRTVVHREVYEHGGLFAFDEMDNGHPGTLAVANACMANDTAAFPDGMVTRSPDCRYVACANTFGTGATRQFIGRNELDAATLDRFETLPIDYDPELEEFLTRAELPGREDEADAWLARVRELRERIAHYKLPVIMGQRASVNGARLLRKGIPWPKVEAMRLRKDLDDNTWSKIAGSSSGSAF